MKLIALTIIMILTYSYMPSMMMFMLISLNYTLMMMSNSNFNYSNTMYFTDSFSMIMMSLTLTSTILIILSSNKYYSIKNTIIPILMILMMTFTFKNMLNFYIMFEIVLVPTMILISMKGKQQERLKASIYLIIYTITASLPLLITIISIKMNLSFNLTNIILYNFNIIMLLLMAFLVKMPMYFTHLWLPKAHVEAPLEGSMILAAVLLKLGGYGLIRFLPLCMKQINKMNYWIISISLLGATATSMNCIRQKDIKSLIAYSSVAHMGFVLASIFSMNFIGLTGAIIMMIAHGMSSSALFLLSNDMYLKFHSRNISLFKGMIMMMPNMTFWWFIYMAINMSAPPTINTFSEIMLMSSLISWNNNTILIIFMMSLATASFSMSMFINIFHNKFFSKKMMNSQQKIHLSMLFHSIPLIMMIMKMETFIMLM
uniref:NADH dehydrogenase subunit 4 n=1 Tax=Asemonea sichuanensis TaxID=426804 RepID=UPI001FAF5EF2|nr:NADH dehydrogenase subunit 4 [Asemonea sichuanensis]ULX45818.1 NADH dehydrogenase subunit 4 [Asemonea sichuanensis]